MYTFSARIEKLGINPYVPVPPEVSEALGGRGNIAVKGTLNGTPIRATLVPTGGGSHRLYINGDMRERAGVGVGDTIELALEVDTSPRALPMPWELSEALESSKEAKAAWYKLTPSRRQEMLAYLNFLKTPAALKKNVEKVVRVLLNKKGK